MIFEIWIYLLLFNSPEKLLLNFWISLRGMQNTFGLCTCMLLSSHFRKVDFLIFILLESRVDTIWNYEMNVLREDSSDERFQSMFPLYVIASEVYSRHSTVRNNVQKCRKLTYKYCNCLKFLSTSMSMQKCSCALRWNFSNYEQLLNFLLLPNTCELCTYMYD